MEMYQEIQAKYVCYLTGQMSLVKLINGFSGLIFNWALWNSLPRVIFVTGDLPAVKLLTEVGETTREKKPALCSTRNILPRCCFVVII